MIIGWEETGIIECAVAPMRWRLVSCIVALDALMMDVIMISVEVRMNEKSNYL